MSSEPETTQATMDAGQNTTNDVPPVEPPIVIEPEPEEDTTPPPPPADPGELNVKVEPATWYEVTSVCSTADMGDGDPCPSLNTTTTEPMVYSNAGTLRMICGPCSKDRPILDYTKLDPQPEMS